MVCWNAEASESTQRRSPASPAPRAHPPPRAQNYVLGPCDGSDDAKGPVPAATAEQRGKMARDWVRARARSARAARPAAAVTPESSEGGRRR